MLVLNILTFIYFSVCVHARAGTCTLVRTCMYTHIYKCMQVCEEVRRRHCFPIAGVTGGCESYQLGC